MAFRTWLYLCRMGLKNLWHNKVYTAASVLTMSSCIFLFGLCCLAALNLDSVLKKTGEEVYVAVFFEEGVSPERVEEVGGLIRSRPEVLKTVYTSAEEAWNGFKEDYFENGELLDGIFEGDNPLAASNHYQVYIDGIGQQEAFVGYVSGLEGVRKAAHSADTVRALLRIRAVILRVAAGGMAVLLLISVLLIHNTLSVGIEAQKEKTHVMRLMGAQEEFLKIPFLVESFVMAIAGMCIPLLLLYVCYGKGMELVAAALSLNGSISLLPAGEVFPKLAAASVLLGIVAGTLGGGSVMGKLRNDKPVIGRP